MHGKQTSFLAEGGVVSPGIQKQKWNLIKNFVDQILLIVDSHRSYVRDAEQGEAVHMSLVLEGLLR